MRQPSTSSRLRYTARFAQRDRASFNPLGDSKSENTTCLVCVQLKLWINQSYRNPSRDRHTRREPHEYPPSVLIVTGGGDETGARKEYRGSGSLARVYVRRRTPPSSSATSERRIPVRRVRPCPFWRNCLAAATHARARGGASRFSRGMATGIPLS